MMFKPHYVATPPLASREQCWEMLAKYLERHAVGRVVVFRVTPHVESETDYDTKRTYHRGFMRFSTSEDTIHDKIPCLPIGLT